MTAPHSLAAARVRRATVAATLGFGLFGAFPAAGQAQSTHVIAGSVTSDSAGAHGIGNVDVLIPALSMETRTNWMGEYRIANVPPGRYAVMARLVGYKAVADSVRIGATDVRLDFVLDQKAVALDSVVTTAAGKRFISGKLAAFDERMRAHATGSFIGDSAFRANENLSMADLLASRLPGMQVAHFGGRIDYAISSRNAGPDVSCGVFQKCPPRKSGNSVLPDLCYVTIFVDGVIRYDGSRMQTGTPPPDLNEFNVNNYAGAEYYPAGGSIPSEFANPNACGTLLLWTREK